MSNIAPDIIIPHTAQKNDLLKRTLPYVQKNIAARKIIIITKSDNFESLRDIVDKNIVLYDEDLAICGLSFERIKTLVEQTPIPDKKTGWYFQQFLKLAWALREDCPQWYVSWDSDTIPLRRIDFFKDGSPYFLKKNEYNPAYFETMEALLGLKKETDFSFIAETMVFNRDVTRELLQKIEANPARAGNSFFEKIISAASASSRPRQGFSEFETYGTYVTRYYPDMYKIKQIPAKRNGATWYGLNPSRFDLYRESKRYGMISFERWSTKCYPFTFLQKCLSFFLYLFDTIAGKREKAYEREF